ncbi:MaoC/PaaZ C-terminal domain-containing protein [Halococcoides cellulosivorans]|uniref:Dehydratase n=1 Tax=Halococcoides cellulosivorans TaxID=1679096 RepID=A0A2R4X143_9EURY|nr:MaoC/PaaZ C-terminal domain-containing protein [Halococcoides cellulosivorans]AWB27517.1 dehydratase [Halococcoides cellulosivorans]
MRTFSALSVGERRRAEPRTVTEDDIVSFGAQFDPQPMHCDADDPIASGWHTAAVTMDAMVECWLSEVAVDVGLGVDQLRWPTPVRPGDRLVTTVEVAAREDYDDRRGRVALDVETTVEGRTVLSMTGLVLVHRDSETN